MPILETLYNASRRTSSNQIYMMLIVLLMRSQDSSFNSSIHKMVCAVFYCRIKMIFLNFISYLITLQQILPSVPWYKEHLLHQTSLGSLMVIILIRTVQHNLSKLRVQLYILILATKHLFQYVHSFCRLVGYKPYKSVIKLIVRYQIEPAIYLEMYQKIST